MLVTGELDWVSLVVLHQLRDGREVRPVKLVATGRTVLDAVLQVQTAISEETDNKREQPVRSQTTHTSMHFRLALYKGT